MALLTSQGPVMIAEGQEWARSKVIATTMVEDEKINKMDHNSYEKDNETNWLNWKHKEINSELVDFYRLLKSVPSFKKFLPVLDSKKKLNSVKLDK